MKKITGIKILRSSITIIFTTLVVGFFASCAGGKAFTQERGHNRGVMSQTYKDGRDTTQGIFIETKDEVRTKAKEIKYIEKGEEEYFEVDGKRVEVNNVFRVQTKDGYFHNFNSRLLPRFITGFISYYKYSYQSTESGRSSSGVYYSNSVTRTIELLEKNNDGKLKSFSLNTLKKMTSDHYETNKMVKKVIKGIRLNTFGICFAGIAALTSTMYGVGLSLDNDPANPTKTSAYVLPGAVLVGSVVGGRYLIKKRNKGSEKLMELIEFYNNNK